MLKFSLSLIWIFAEVFEEVLEIVSYMTFFSPTISIDMWTLWPLMMEALADWAIDFFPSTHSVYHPNCFYFIILFDCYDFTQVMYTHVIASCTVSNSSVGYVVVLRKEMNSEHFNEWDFFLFRLCVLFWFIADILVPLDNYISRGTAHFLTCKEPNYQQSLWNMISSVSFSFHC